jgi:hypothetical protein
MTDIAIKQLLSELVSLPHLDPLHYLLTESEGKHIAHCLDIDLIATGDTREKAAVKLDSLVKAHIELTLATRQYENIATRAPQIYWDQYTEGNPVELEPRTLRIQIPESVQIVPVPESKLRVLARAAHAA